MGRWLITGSLLTAAAAFAPPHKTCVPVVRRGNAQRTFNDVVDDDNCSFLQHGQHNQHTALFSSPTKGSEVKKIRRRNKSFSGGSKRKSSSPELSWLKWMDARLEETLVGKLPPKVMKQMHPIMNLYAKQRSIKGAEKANKLMGRLLKESEAGNADAKLSTKICNTVLSAWAKSGGGDQSSERATKLLIWMSKNSREGTYDVKPNTISFSTVIDSWARSGVEDGAAKAEAILKLMEREGAVARPNTVSFNSCINAHARSDAMDKAVRAEELVNRMEDLYEAGNQNVRPDVWTYQSLLSAWSTAKVWGAPQRCEEILKMMDNKHKAGDDAVKPNAHCFTACINSWSKSFEKDKARSVYRILQYMNKLYADGNFDAKPNVVAYTAALNACAYPEASEDDAQLRQYFDIGTLILEELRMSPFGQPSYVTYATFLQVCANCLPEGEERDRTVRRTFDECRQDGQVGDAVIQQLKNRFPSLYGDIFSKDIGRHGDELRSKHLPKEWRRNVTGERRSAFHPKRKDYADIDRDDVSKLKVISRNRGSRGFYSKEMNKGKEGADAGEGIRKEEHTTVESGSFDEITVIL